MSLFFLLFCLNYYLYILSYIVLNIFFLTLYLITYYLSYFTFVFFCVQPSQSNLRQILLNVRAISAKNIYQKTTHSTVTFSMLFETSHSSSLAQVTPQ